ncbi:MAG: THUMP domain-containing protein [Myxococcota bacterium]|jgi:putative N6-adenine-specific DNA methylase
MARLPLYATASRGTEPYLAQELEALGARRIRQDRGGVRFLADLDEILRVCLHSRVAMRVLYPLGTFEARGAEGLYEAARAVAWEEWLDAKTTFAVDATLKDSEHDHSGFVALKLKDAIVDRLREKLGRRPDVDTRRPTYRVVAHLAKTTLSLSLDLCGEPLFKRGYRVKTTPAPLKETLAASMLIAAGYTGEEPLADPMCGSGTLVIEAAYLAQRRAPGLKRHFALEDWPLFSQKAKPLLEDLKREAHAMIRPPPFPIIARDRDEDALAAVKRNVVAAGLSTAVRIEEADVLHAGAPDCAPGLLITNPPYGERLGSGGQKGMKSFFFSLSKALERWPGWRLAILAGNPAFESAFHRRPSRRAHLWNGPIDCALLQYPPLRPEDAP